MSTFTASTAFPPSLIGLPYLAMLTQVSYWAMALFCLQWIYSILDDRRNTPAPAGSYVSVARAVKLRLILVAFALIAPRLALLLAWGKMSPAVREFTALAAWAIVVPCALILARAWWKDRAARPTESRLVANFTHYRFVEVSPPTPHEKLRGVVGLVLIIVIAFATTFVRLEPGHVPQRTVAAGLR